MINTIFMGNYNSIFIASLDFTFFLISIHNIQKSKHLLKRLNENFLNSLLDQAQFMALELKVNQVRIDNIINDCFRENIEIS